MALWQKASNVFQLMRGVRVEADAAARHAALSESPWQLTQSLLKIESDAKDINDAASLQARACASAHLWSEACAVLEELVRSRLQPAIQVHTAVVGAFSACASWQLACQQAEDMPSIGADPQFYTTAAGTCSKAAQWLHTLHLLRKASVGHDIAIFGVLLYALAKGQQLESLLSVLKDLETSRLRLNSALVSAAVGAFGASALPGSGARTESPLRPSDPPVRELRLFLTRPMASQQADVGLGSLGFT